MQRSKTVLSSEKSKGMKRSMTPSSNIDRLQLSASSMMIILQMQAERQFEMQGQLAESHN